MQSDEAAPTGAATSSQEVGWATGEDVSDAPFADRVLPIIGKRVRIRYLTNEEATEIAVLPDLGKFAELTQKLAEDLQRDEDKPSLFSREQQQQYLVERARYNSFLVHRAVMVPDADPNAFLPCNECDGRHPLSLFTMLQARRIDGRDVEVIAAVAEDREVLERSLPFSQDPTDSASTPPADSGDEIPLTNSA